MEWEKVAEKIRDLILGEIKEEFRDFKSSVTGELNGFRLAIESMNSRISGIESRISGIESRMASLEVRQEGLENELRDIRRAIENTNMRIDETNKRIDETNKTMVERIDELRVELKEEIAQNTMRIDETNKRIDETNKRIDALYLEVSEMRGEVKEALSRKEVVQDMLLRIERLETKVLT